MIAMYLLRVIRQLLMGAVCSVLRLEVAILPIPAIMYWALGFTAWNHDARR